MARPRVSVVVATWNRQALLQRLVSQLEAQSLPPGELEVVVVDDGSQPPTALGGPGRDGRVCVRLLRQDNAGPARARHQGILAAAGDLVVLVDDDMSVGPGFAAAHLARHSAPRRVVLGEIRPDPGLPRMPLFERFHALMLGRFASDLESGRLRLNGTHVCTGNVSFPRSDYLAVGGFDPGLDRSEDAELGLRLEKAGLELVFDKTAFSVHGSDHASLDTWMRRAFRYGINDRRIGRKHADTPAADPWRFVDLMSPAARPLLILSALAPRLGRLLASSGMRLAMACDRLGLEGPALAGTTVVYAMQYFRGVRQESGSLGTTFADWRFRHARAAGRA